jgi:hypothetical protein
LLVWCKADGAAAEPASVTAPVDERVEHQFEKFIGQLHRGSLGAGCHFARALHETHRREAKKLRWQAAGHIEGIDQRLRDILLVLIEPGK